MMSLEGAEAVVFEFGLQGVFVVAGFELGNAIVVTGGERIRFRRTSSSQPLGSSEARQSRRLGGFASVALTRFAAIL
jgi:hypothetical protein